MKKITLISLITLFVSFLIIGCGSNTRQDPLPPGGGGVSENGFELTNVTDPFDIGYAGQQETFQVQLIQNGIPVSGQPVSAASLPATFGFVDKATTSTNESGYAIFGYTAADPLTNGVMPLELIYDDNGSHVTATLNINVLEGTVPFDYKFVATTTPVYITQASQAVNISSYIMDKDNNPQKEKMVSIAPLDVKYGAITPLASVSGESGMVSFNYQAPADLTGLSSTSTIMSYVEGDYSISQSIDIIFQGSGYKLTNVTTPILINQGGQKAEISGYLVDESNNGVAGESVSITPVATGYGSVTPSVSTTDVSGKAIFQYEAPLHLTGLSGTHLTMSYFDGTATVSAHVEITILGGDATGYELINAKNPYYVYSAAQTELFDIQLVKNGSPVLDAAPCITAELTLSKSCVAITSLDRRFGRFQGTDSAGGAGYVYFGYVAPADEDKASNGENTTFIAEYIDEDGQVAATSAPVTLRMRY